MRLWRRMAGPRCSFYGDSQVRRLITGGTAFICDKVRAHGRRIIGANNPEPACGADRDVDLRAIDRSVH